MVCKKCGAPTSEGSLFCPHCGTKAESAPVAYSFGNSWFTSAGGLDDQLSGVPARKVDTPAELPLSPAREKPVKPIVTPAREETAPPVPPQLYSYGDTG